jgi:2'-5' RNA ligase
MNGRLRCFVAVNLPEGIREGIGAFLDREAGGVPGVAWVAPPRLHMTLKFLGDVEERRIPGLGEALDAGLSGAAPFTLGLQGAGAFPSVERPRVVWVGVSAGARELAALAGAVEDALAPLGFPREPRPFAPHLTVGRVRARIREAGALPRLVSAAARAPFGSFLVPAAHLMRSELFPSGPTYSILHETSLSGTPRAAEGAST